MTKNIQYMYHRRRKKERKGTSECERKREGGKKEKSRSRPLQRTRLVKFRSFSYTQTISRLGSFKSGTRSPKYHGKLPSYPGRQPSYAPYPSHTRFVKSRRSGDLHLEEKVRSSLGTIFGVNPQLLSLPIQLASVLFTHGVLICSKEQLGSCFGFF